MIHVWTVIYGLLALVWALDGLRMRKRASSLLVLEDSDEEVSPSHRFVTRAGVVLDEATQRAASAFARKNKLSVVDLVPRDLPARRAMFFLQLVDVALYRKDPMAVGTSAGEAMLVDTDVLERMRQAEGPQPDVLAMCELARRVKLYASMQTDFAVAPRLHAAPEDKPRNRELVRFHFSNFAPAIILVQSSLALAGPLLSPIAGSIALGTMHLQALLATVGTRLRPRGIFVYALLRTVLDILATLDPFAPPARDHVAALAEKLRPTYEKLLANGTTSFFEERRPDCPMCSGKNLRQKITVKDRLQQKPGRFTLEECRDCGHVFQNPRLSIDGLNFYYKDFYDGIGEDDLENIFRSSLTSYRDRARMVRAVVEPARWLDVGTGHGHFCMLAREEWPKTEFDGIDLSESIEDAERRRWIHHGYRGLFPDMASELAGKYDVVSMSHYLEHTREPRAEIEAAAKVVRPGGALLVEVPDPESRMGKLFGSWWLPWFQPQHQHFVSIGRLEKLMRESGFEPAVVHRGEAHQVVDFVLGVGLFMNMIAPPPNRPWRKRTGWLSAFRNYVLWLLAIPMLLVARLLDVVLAPLLRRARWSNTYRVVARRL